MIQYNIKDLPIKSVNHQFLKDFERYMRVNNSNSNNGAMKNMVRLKKIIRIALHGDLIKSDPFGNFKISFDKPDRVYLNADELRTIELIILESNKLARVKDIFVFMCYTGLAFVDLKALTRDMISKGADGYQWIIGNRIKSSERYAIPVLPVAERILIKYFDENSLLALPVLSNQKMNDYLKEIAAICGINKPLSCHSGRHTFATTVTLENGVPIETVSRMLGHTDLRTTQIYARVLDSKVSRDMAILRSNLSNPQ